MDSLRQLRSKHAARLRTVSRRQAAAVLAVFLLCAGVAVSAGTGRLAIAATLLAVLLAASLAALLRVSRRIGQLHQVNRMTHDDLRTIAEQTQRRLVAAMEHQRLAAGDAQRDVLEAMTHNQKTALHDVDLLLRAQSREVEALVQLFQTFTPRAPMPSSGNFALNPTDLLDLLHLIRTRRPQLVLELGSGTSSVWIGYAVETYGGRVVSLEHEPEYAGKTRAALETHGLTRVAEVRDAPLRQLQLGGRTFRWYDTEALAGLRDIDLVLVDGPPEKTGPEARYPALGVLEKQLAATATVICDDANRPGEQLAVQRWIEAIPGLTRETELLGRHAVLSYVRAPSAETTTVH